MRRTESNEPQITVVAPIVARFDAVSAAVLDTVRAIEYGLGVSPTVLTYRSDFPELNTHITPLLTDIIADEAYTRSDALIYHMAVHAPMFDLLNVGAPNARQIVRYHNTTPLEFVPEHDRPSIKRALRQAHVLAQADIVWADSKVNAEAAMRYGVAAERIEVVPLATEFPSCRDLCSKPIQPIRLLFVGRVVPSKGVLELIDVLGRLAEQDVADFQATIVGNTEWSPSNYVNDVRERITQLGLSNKVTLETNVETELLASYYHQSHVFVLPSLHEGFCKPVIEALRAGCVPVTFDAYNLRYISGGHGRTVRTGDVTELFHTIGDVIEGLQEGVVRTDRGSRTLVEFDRDVDRYTAEFTFDTFAARTTASLRSLLDTRLTG